MEVKIYYAGNKEKKMEFELNTRKDYENLSILAKSENFRAELTKDIDDKDAHLVFKINGEKLNPTGVVRLVASALSSISDDDSKKSKKKKKNHNKHDKKDKDKKKKKKHGKKNKRTHSFEYDEDDQPKYSREVSNSTSTESSPSKKKKKHKKHHNYWNDMADSGIFDNCVVIHSRRRR